MEITMTASEREKMIGKLFVSDMNHPVEMATKVLDIRPNAGGYTVMHQRKGMLPVYKALSQFVKRYPHQIEELAESAA